MVWIKTNRKFEWVKGLGTYTTIMLFLYFKKIYTSISFSSIFHFGWSIILSRKTANSEFFVAKWNNLANIILFLIVRIRLTSHQTNKVVESIHFLWGRLDGSPNLRVMTESFCLSPIFPIYLFEKSRTFKDFPVIFHFGKCAS